MKSKRLLAGPYLFWAVSFIIIPLLMIVYYGLTAEDGSFTLMNIARITTAENLKALGLAILLAVISTYVDELFTENDGMAESPGEKWCFE